MKEQIREKAKEYAKKNNGKHFNDTYPSTANSIGEVCIMDFTAGYEQCLKDNPQTNSLLIAMLESQLKVERVRNESLDITARFAHIKIIRELERQLNELKG